MRGLGAQSPPPCCHGPRAARLNAGPAYLAATPPDLLLVPGGKDARRRDPDLVAWLAMDELARSGAKPRGKPYVRDGEYVTAAGVFAGIDMALALAGRIGGVPGGLAPPPNV